MGKKDLVCTTLYPSLASRAAASETRYDCELTDNRVILVMALQAYPTLPARIGHGEKEPRVGEKGGGDGERRVIGRGEGGASRLGEEMDKEDIGLAAGVLKGCVGGGGM
jgi:hypothetical protein